MKVWSRKTSKKNFKNSLLHWIHRQTWKCWKFKRKKILKRFPSNEKQFIIFSHFIQKSKFFFSFSSLLLLGCMRERLYCERGKLNFMKKKVFNLFIHALGSLVGFSREEWNALNSIKVRFVGVTWRRKNFNLRHHRCVMHLEKLPTNRGIQKQLVK